MLPRRALGAALRSLPRSAGCGLSLASRTPAHLVRASAPAAQSALRAGVLAFSTSARRADAGLAAAEPAPARTADENLSADGEPVPPRDNTFASLKPHLDYSTWKALAVKPFGYEKMSEVQEAVLHLLPELSENVGGTMSNGKGRDLLVKARTGTGKTIAFLTPALETRINALHKVERGRFSPAWQRVLDRYRPDLDFAALDKHGRQEVARQYASNSIGTLILSPTRELAMQIAAEAVKLTSHHKDFGVQLLVGGESRGLQLKAWRRGRPDIVVATPGRMNDILSTTDMVREAAAACETLVLDEADTLLQLGFHDEIKAISKFLPPSAERNTMLFSATVSPEIRKVAEMTLERNHHFIDCVPPGEENVHERIPQFATVLDSPADQLKHIMRLVALDQLRNPGKSKIIIFAPTTALTMVLGQLFSNPHILAALPASEKGPATEVSVLHSKKDQWSRTKASDAFRHTKSGASILVTSDVSARGVDYPGTTRVIQVGPPATRDTYIHRIGRTGRAGSDGRADLVLMDWEAGWLDEVRSLPVQNASVADIKAELATLAASYDSDPTSVVSQETLDLMQAAAAELGAGRRAGRTRSIAPLVQPGMMKDLVTTQLDRAVEAGVTKIDPQVIEDTFMSQVGFYVARSGEMRINKAQVVAGLKGWATGTMGLDHEPFISPAFLAKLGVKESRGKPQSFRGGYAPRGRGGFGASRGGRGPFASFGAGSTRFGEERGTPRFGEERSTPRFGEERSTPRFGEDRGGSRFGEERRGGGYSASRGGRGGYGGGSSRFGEERGSSRFGGERGDRFGNSTGGSRFGSRNSGADDF